MGIRHASIALLLVKELVSTMEASAQCLLLKEKTGNSSTERDKDIIEFTQ